jgi:lipid II:glycine glycyltransferase (peptidoglycan interpeptide bridge formation enzyme)
VKYKHVSTVARENRCLFIKVEPKVESQESGSRIKDLVKLGFVEGRSLFTKYNFLLDVTPSEAELLASFKQKTRYNIKVAEKRGVTVELDNSETAFKRYLELTEETTQRQGFYAHGSKYHRMMWEILGNNQSSNSNNQLTAHLLVAKYQGEIITTWILFKFGDTLYYPYGASTREHREVMANNLVMWEAIKLAKQWELRYLDMWGALGPEPDSHDPWYGFHTFKSGYGARHVEYVGTWDYVAMPLLYKLYRIGENLRWWWLRAKKARD